MNKILKYFGLIIIVSFSPINVAQEQEETDPFFYKVNGLVYLYEYTHDSQDKRIGKAKIPKEGLKFKIVRNGKTNNKDSSYHVIKFLRIINDDIVVGCDSIGNLKGDTTFINSDDNEKYFWILKAELDSLKKNKFITLSYRTPNTHLTYGASVSLPFKLRTKTAGQNIKITPDITLGGYIGAKFRISQTKKYYLNAPVVTLGLTTLSINDGNNPSNTSKGDGLVMGITTSTGLIADFDGFQFGLMLGWDWAGGELGKNWIYNDRIWYSFSIGVTFLGTDDQK